MAGTDPSIFAIELETMAMKAFGDMSQMARMRLVRDRLWPDRIVVRSADIWIV